MVAAWHAGCFSQGEPARETGRETGSNNVPRLSVLTLLILCLPAAQAARAQAIDPRPDPGRTVFLLAQAESGTQPEPSPEKDAAAPFLRVFRDPVSGEVMILGKLGGNGTRPSPERGAYPGHPPDLGGDPSGGPYGPPGNGTTP